MEEFRLVVEVEGFDRVLYKEPANWGKCNLSQIDCSTAIIEVWENDIDSLEKLKATAVNLKEKIERLILSIEWAYGHELKWKISKIYAPSFVEQNNILEITESLRMQDQVDSQVAPREVPTEMPQIPLEAKRWIQIWVEACKLGEYVEEQLRRQYLIIEELWNEFNSTFDAQSKADKRQIKLIRDFVSHASCNNVDIVTLIEPDIPTAVHVVNGVKRVAFQRTVEHRNYISRFEVKSRKIARTLVDMKMRQFGSVSGI